MLDRAAHLRTQPHRIAELVADARARFVPVWRNRVLVDDGGERPQPCLLPQPAVAPLLEGAETIFLGLLDDAAVFAIGLDAASDPSEELQRLVPAGAFYDLRGVGMRLARSDADLLAYARHMLFWHRQHQHCGRCGGAMRIADAGHVRECPACDKRSFPRTDPAVMAAIVSDGELLLARQPNFPPGMFSILAGFVEPGESLEQTVVREVREEVGLAVTDVRYVASQPWPFPRSLMIGFAMRATHRDFVVDGEELEEARWCTPAQIQAGEGLFVPPTYSLAGQLIERFVQGTLLPPPPARTDR